MQRAVSLQSEPTLTKALAAFLFDDDKETLELLTSTYSYPDQKKMIQFEVRPWFTNTEEGVDVGNIFYGSEGYMLVKNYDAYETYLGPKKVKGPARRAGGRCSS